MKNGNEHTSGEDAAAEATASIVAAIQRAEQALENIRRALKDDTMKDVGAKAAAAAATLLSEGEALVSESEALTRANVKLSSAVKRNPLVALGVAFGAGMLLALLTRG